VVSRIAAIAGVCAFATWLSGCEGPQGGSDGITGRERIAWDQQASDRAQLATFEYALYVDGTRNVLAGAACDDTPGPEGFGCSAPLPGLAPGVRVLELASFVVSGGTVLESAKSAPLRVTVASRAGTGSTTGFVVAPGSSFVAGDGADGGDGTAAEGGGTRAVTADGVRLAADVIATGLTAPVDFAQAPDGRLFVAERGGRVLLIDPADGGARVALQIGAPDDADGEAANGTRLLSLALGPDFHRTRFVFLVASVPDGLGAGSFQLARHREAGGVLVERVVLLEGVAAPENPSALVRVGPDRRLYVSFEDEDAAADAGGYGGKILRLTSDGALPSDNPGRTSLVYSWGEPAPRAFDWQPGDGALWLVGRSRGGRDELARVRPGGTAEPAWTLSRDVQPGATGVAFYGEGPIEPFRGNFFIAAADGAHLLRLVFDPSDPSRIVARERLFAHTFGRIGQVVAGRDGAIYLSTDNAREHGAGRDVLVAIRPAR
jgi:aldose sugar dehydrogenase